MAADPVDLATIAEVKEFLGSASSTEDSLFQALVTHASMFMESFASRRFKDTIYTLTASGIGSAACYLPNSPVISVTSVTIDGVVIPAATGASDSGWLRSRRLVMLRGYSFTRGVQNIVIVYHAGYVEVPHDIKQGCIDLVVERYRSRSWVGMNSRSLGGESLSFSREDLPPHVKLVLSQRREVVPAS